jgi:hypothetical protein
MAVTFINSDRKRVDLVFIVALDYIISRLGTFSLSNIPVTNCSDLRLFRYFRRSAL